MIPEQAKEAALWARAGADDRAVAKRLGLGVGEFRALLAEGDSPGSPAAQREFTKDYRVARAVALFEAQHGIHEKRPEQWVRRLRARRLELSGESPADRQCVVWRIVLRDPTLVVPRCLNPMCDCILHYERSAQELQRTRRMKVTFAKPKASRGRPTGAVSLTPRISQTILSAIRLGASDFVAAGVAGVSDRTLRGWLEKGKTQKGVLVAFRRDYEMAVAEAEMSALARLKKENPLAWHELVQEQGEAAGARTHRLSSAEIIVNAVRDEFSRLHATRRTLAARCPNPACKCMWHRERTEEELTRTLARRASRWLLFEEGSFRTMLLRERGERVKEEAL